MVEQSRSTCATHLKKAVKYSHGHVHGLLKQAKLQAHLHQPVDENGTHVTSHFLALQISSFNILFNLRSKPEISSVHRTEPSTIRKNHKYLKLPEVLVDVLHIFTAEHRVVVIVSIHIPNGSPKNDS